MVHRCRCASDAVDRRLVDSHLARERCACRGRHLRSRCHHVVPHGCSPITRFSGSTYARHRGQLVIRVIQLGRIRFGPDLGRRAERPPHADVRQPLLALRNAERARPHRLGGNPLRSCGERPAKEFGIDRRGVCVIRGHKKKREALAPLIEDLEVHGNNCDMLLFDTSHRTCVTYAPRGYGSARAAERLLLAIAGNWTRIYFHRR